MKIHPHSTTQNIGSTTRSREIAGRTTERPDTRTERVEVSESARFVERVRRAAREEEQTVRAVEVARVRDQLAKGTYESSVDLERVVDGLLGDL